MKLLITKWTVRQIETDVLEEALKQTKDKRKIHLIEQELKTRKMTKNQIPTMEDFLG